MQQNKCVCLLCVKEIVTSKITEVLRAPFTDKNLFVHPHCMITYNIDLRRQLKHAN